MDKQAQDRKASAPRARGAVKIPDLSAVEKVVVEIAQAEFASDSSGNSLANKRRNKTDCQHKDDGSVVTSTDIRLQQMLSEQLTKLAPSVPILAEEMNWVDHVRVLSDSHGGFWAIDPLDGTSNYNAGVPMFAVSVAYVLNYEPVLGVVYDPNRNESFTAAAGKGARLNGELLGPSPVCTLRASTASIDYKRIMGQLAARLVRSPPYGSHRSLGSSVLDWCWLTCGRFQLYLHGGQKLWDYAAGSLILREAGGVIGCLDGSWLDCSSMAKRSVVAASNEQLFDAWSEWVGENLRAALERRR